MPLLMQLDRPRHEPPAHAPSDIEPQIHEIGRELFSRARHPQDKFLREWPWDQWMMTLGMHDAQIKAQLFRFVDVLPVLTRSPEINRHLREYLYPVRKRLPGGQLLPLIPEHGAAARALASLTHWGARRMARRFIAGSDVCEAAKTILRLRRRKLA